MHIKKQKGLTLIGFIMVLGLSIFIAYLGMRIVPLYMEYYAVISAMNGIAAERGSAQLPPPILRRKLKARLYVSYSDNVKDQHIQVSRNNGVRLRVKYEVRKPVMGNLDVVAKFDRSVRLLSN